MLLSATYSKTMCVCLFYYFFLFIIVIIVHSLKSEKIICLLVGEAVLQQLKFLPVSFILNFF